MIVFDVEFVTMIGTSCARASRHRRPSSDSAAAPTTDARRMSDANDAQTGAVTAPTAANVDDVRHPCASDAFV